MPGFWEHYARVNDDIRHELIDKTWMEGRAEKYPAMQNDVQTMAARSAEPKQAYGRVNSQNPDVPDALQQTGMRDGTDQNPETTKEAVEKFYGLRDHPQGTELGKDFEDERKLTAQHEAAGNVKAVYGEDVKQQEKQKTQGYDALDEEPKTQVQAPVQRM